MEPGSSIATAALIPAGATGNRHAASRPDHFFGHAHSPGISAGWNRIPITAGFALSEGSSIELEDELKVKLDQVAQLGTR